MAETQAQALPEALRAEILKLATEGEKGSGGALTPDVLLRIERVAKTGRSLLVSLSVSPSNLAQMIKRPNPFGWSGPNQEDDVMDSGINGALGNAIPYASASPSENFGMTALREIIAATKNLNGNNNGTSPVKLVEALVLAREKGLADVAKELETQLGIWKAVSALPAPQTKPEVLISAGNNGVTKTVAQVQET